MHVSQIRQADERENDGEKKERGIGKEKIEPLINIKTLLYAQFVNGGRHAHIRIIKRSRNDSRSRLHRIRAVE